MDDITTEAKNISRILNYWDFGFFVGALRKHAHEKSHKRIQLVLIDYFRTKDSILSPKSKEEDVDLLQAIFPDETRDDIRGTLEEIGNEENQLRIAVKMLLKKSGCGRAKRAHSADGSEDGTKKSKFDSDFDETSSSSYTSSSSSSTASSRKLIDSLSTISQSQPSDVEVLVIKDEASDDDVILLSDTRHVETITLDEDTPTKRPLPGPSHVDELSSHHYGVDYDVPSLVRSSSSSDDCSSGVKEERDNSSVDRVKEYCYDLAAVKEEVFNVSHVIKGERSNERDAGPSCSYTVPDFNADITSSQSDSVDLSKGLKTELKAEPIAEESSVNDSDITSSTRNEAHLQFLELSQVLDSLMPLNDNCAVPIKDFAEFAISPSTSTVNVPVHKNKKPVENTININISVTYDEQNSAKKSKVNGLVVNEAGSSGAATFGSYSKTADSSSSSTASVYNKRVMDEISNADEQIQNYYNYLNEFDGYNKSAEINSAAVSSSTAPAPKYAYNKNQNFQVSFENELQNLRFQPARNPQKAVTCTITSSEWSKTQTSSAMVGGVQVVPSREAVTAAGWDVQSPTSTVRNHAFPQISVSQSLFPKDPQPASPLTTVKLSRKELGEWEVVNDGNDVAEASRAKNSLKWHSPVARTNNYKHLQTVLGHVPLDRIKSVCSRYNVAKHTKVPEKILAIIVEDLLTTFHPTSNNEVAAAEDDFDPPEITQEELMEPILKAEQEAISELNNRVQMAVNSVTATATDATRIAVPNMYGAAAARAAHNPPGVPRNLPSTSNTPSTTSNNSAMTISAPVKGQALPEEAAPEWEELAEDNPLVYRLMEMFPTACPNFLRTICKGTKNTPEELDVLISTILDSDYPKRIKVASPNRAPIDPEQQLQMLKDILPDADPTFLQIKCVEHQDEPAKIEEFIAHALKDRIYPKMKDYLRRQQISAQQKQYTVDFSVEKYLEVIPDPATFIKEAEKKEMAIEGSDLFAYQNYVIMYLRNKFLMVQLQSIRGTFHKLNYHFVKTYRALKKINRCYYLRNKRAYSAMPEAPTNIPLLQQMAYFDHKDEIERHLLKIKEEEKKEFLNAKAAGLLQTCSCCFDDEVMLKNVCSCEKDCTFCKECVCKGAEVAFGDGKLDFPCLNNCPSYFSLQTLKAVLNPKMFSRIAQKKQLEEVKAAGIEDLESCPFCDFATIPAKTDKIFRCLNPDCMKESCRLCKEPSHVPLRCDEVEKDDEVKKRIYIENRMTEALLRTCYRCSKKFVKDDGCNKMTCTCGAMMCYVCKQPVQDYKHFNGPNGDQTHLCPLYSDTHELHKNAVLQSAEEAKQEIGLEPNATLKIDPTADVTDHYKKMAKKKPAQVFHAHNPFDNMNPRDRQQQQRALEIILQHRHHRQHHHH